MYSTLKDFIENETQLLELLSCDKNINKLVEYMLSQM